MRDTWLTRLLLIALAAVTIGTVAGAHSSPAPMAWPDLLGRPKPDYRPVRVAYGADPLQFAELWLPAGRGPHPVAVMVHGGCWRTAIAERDIMDWAAEDLRRRGIAVWNIEYRGIDRPGGGYPGTYRDVAAGADALRGQAARYGLRLAPIVATGHSAGGHLALWLAARPRIPADSPLHAADPLRIATVVASGAMNDLEYEAGHPDRPCDLSEGARIMAGPGRPAPWRDTSPAALSPSPARLVFVSGALDRIAPPHLATDYAARTRTHPRIVEIAGEGHVELIAPGSAAWAAEVAAIRQGLGLR